MSTAAATMPRTEESARAGNIWFIAVAVVIATFMVVLDTSVANVALRYIAGGLSASVVDSDWVVTSYLAASAVVMPLCGWLSTLLGRRNYFVMSIGVFTLASALCGLSSSLPELILWRIVQGIAGGGMIPAAQAILLDTFPRARAGTAMAIYGIAVVVAPIVGPTLGGWLTVDYSWRWVFFINVPVGIAAILLNSWLLSDPPYLRADRARMRSQPFYMDYVGLSLLVIGFGCLETLNSKGQQWDWLGDPFGRVQTLMLGCIVGIGGVIAWSLHNPRAMIDIRLYREPNYAICNVIGFFLFGTFYGGMVILPDMLQTLFGYDALAAGLVMSPAGIFAVAATILVGWLQGRGVDARWLVAAGLIIMGGAFFWLSQLNLFISPSEVTWPYSFVMVGLITGFSPLNAAAFTYLTAEERSRGTGTFALVRGEGGSIGTAMMVSTLLVRRSQFHSERLGEHVSVLDHNTMTTWEKLNTMFSERIGDLPDSHLMAWRAIGDLRDQQALALSYFDTFYVSGVLCLCVLPLVFFMRRSVASKGVHAGME